MKVRYFADTDTLLIEFRDVPVAESRDLDENRLPDLNAQGNIRSITVEHASTRADARQFSYEQVAASQMLPVQPRRCSYLSPSLWSVASERQYHVA